MGFLRFNPQTYLINALLLIALQSEVYCEYCPSTCKCQFDDQITDNSAKCHLDNNTLSMVWENSRRTQYRSLLIVTCKGSKEFQCRDVPQFNNQFYRLKLRTCMASLIKCIKWRRDTIIDQIEILNMIGPYTKGSFEILGEVVRELKLNLNDDDSTLPIATINELYNLKRLYVNGGNYSLSPKMFKDTPTLELLELNNNNINVLHAEYFQELKCSRLNIINNKMERISAGTFKVINNLNELQIAETKLKYIELGAFASNSITHLRLEKNLIEFLPNGFLDGLPKFEELMFMSNKVSLNLDTRVFAELPESVKWIELYKFKLHNLSADLFANSINLKTLKLHETKIEELPTGIFRNLTSLTILSLSGNRLKYIPKGLFSQLIKLESLNLNFNSLTTIETNQFSFSPNLIQLLLSQNKITTIDIKSFSGTRLQKLILLGNELESITGDTSDIWKNMVQLDLANNKLKTFEHLIYGLYNLTNVDLSRNEITSIRENKTYFLKSNALIDLRRNQISHVIKDPSFLNIKDSNITLYLSENPLICDCLLTTVFHQWNKAGLVRRFEDILCSDKQILADIDAYIFCNKEQALTALIGTSVLGSLIILIMLISLFANRKKIWHYILDSMRRESSVAPVPIEMPQEQAKPYDVFISFAHQDEEFVSDQLLPMLEIEFGLKVCVHYRDWVVGELIPVQIKESVESSKITLILLTEHFLESEWSYLEFRTAHDLSIEDGKPRVVLVLLNEAITKHEKLSPDLKLYISINTYLLWKDQQFWDKLKRVLPESEKHRLMKNGNKR